MLYSVSAIIFKVYSQTLINLIRNTTYSIMKLAGTQAFVP